MPPPLLLVTLLRASRAITAPRGVDDLMTALAHRQLDREARLGSPQAHDHGPVPVVLALPAVEPHAEALPQPAEAPAAPWLPAADGRQWPHDHGGLRSAHLGGDRV